MSVGGTRINKFLAACGVASRRKAEQLIRDGRVTCNGSPISDLASRVGPEDSIKVDGKRVRPTSEVTILLYKPRGYLCTQDDPQGRDTIYDLLPPKFQRLVYVGRLDKESEGLILLTSCGDLCQQLSHPRHKIEKEYHVLTHRPLEREEEQRFLEGIHTPEGLARADHVTALKKNWVSIVLRQGLKRQIRYMFAAVDLEVKRLIRTRIGDLVAPSLQPGHFVELEADGLALVTSNPAA